MAISSSQAKTVTGLYSLSRKYGVLETAFGKKLFTGSYFLYKRYLEDPFAGLTKRRPDLFHGGDILDIGANIGYTASLFAHAADVDATVYAFEPEPFNFSLLKTAISRRRLERKVVAMHSAVGQSNGTIQLWINDHHHGDHRIATDLLRSNVATAQYVTVPITSIDTFLAGRISARPVSFIKIDVQGYELAVCQGMAATVAREPRCAVAIEYMPEAMTALGYDPHALLDWFSEGGFEMYSLGKRGHLSPGMSSELSQKGYVDLVFSRSHLL
jgi:FkbM family methyltransferase